MRLSEDQWVVVNLTLRGLGLLLMLVLTLMALNAMAGNIPHQAPLTLSSAEPLTPATSWTTSVDETPSIQLLP